MGGDSRLDNLSGCQAVMGVYLITASQKLQRGPVSDKDFAILEEESAVHEHFSTIA